MPIGDFIFLYYYNSTSIIITYVTDKIAAHVKEKPNVASDIYIRKRQILMLSFFRVIATVAEWRSGSVLGP